MRLLRASIRNFKGVADLEVDFTSQPGEEPRQMTALIGDNGCGKTTALQAIALTLSLATRRTRDPSTFAWHGFLAERLSSLGPARVELDVALEEGEVSATTELYEDWYDTLSSDWVQTHRVVEPSRQKCVTLVYERGRCTSPQGFEGMNQFLGRYYVKTLLATQPEKRGFFAKLGDVFWFDQHRNLGSILGGRHTEAATIRRDSGGGGGSEGWEAGVEQLREFLVGWWGYHTSASKGNGKDYVALLEGKFENLFPGTKFIGVSPRESESAPNAKDFYFLLEREGRVYDLAEMSSGEQAVFPLLYEFVRLDIARSVVLIDELELHLHPPEQQALLGMLRRLGPDCQFIITTHSPYLADVLPPGEVVRMEGKRQCL